MEWVRKNWTILVLAASIVGAASTLKTTVDSHTKELQDLNNELREYVRENNDSHSQMYRDLGELKGRIQ